MFESKRFNLHRDESGQTALETAIILIAFVVVASVFAFTILSAGNASTEKGEKAIYAGLQGVASSMEVKGMVVADKTAAATETVKDVVFTVALVSGGDPVDLTTAATPGVGTKTIIGYRDATQEVKSLKYAVTFPVGNANTMLETGELAEITVTLATGTGSLATALGPSTAFTLEIKPQTGSVIQINRTTPAALNLINELH